MNKGNEGVKVTTMTKKKEGWYVEIDHTVCEDG